MRLNLASEHSLSLSNSHHKAIHRDPVPLHSAAHKLEVAYNDVDRMLLEASSELNRLPQQWLQQLLDHMQRPGQSMNDIVRRSAGLPAAFVALFTAEPTGHPKTLLHTGELHVQ